MRKSIFISILLIIMIVNGLLISFIVKKQNSISNGTLNEYIVDEEQIKQTQEESEIPAISETDKNIIGYITIKKIGLEKAPIADGTDLVTINSYVGHFKESSYLDGNICLCSHNRGGKGAYFGNLKNLEQGDIITYITKYETKEYVVNEIKVIDETDFSVIEPTEDNKITLLTCVENIGNKRLCVIGTQNN